MDAQHRCRNAQRWLSVRDKRRSDGSPIVNGIDYVEILRSSISDANGVHETYGLLVHFIHPLAGSLSSRPTVPGAAVLSTANLVVTSDPDLLPALITQCVIDDPADGRVLRTDLIVPDASLRYTLRLVGTPPDPPQGFDPQLSQVSFALGRSATEDCLPPQACPPDAGSEPAIDYLAKDYASFRRLMLDRLAILMPDWQERNAADVGVVLIELLAYVGDQLSYYQDAVATEAYLGTARRRVSLRRHARLLDWFVHDGCNARAFVALQVGASANGKTLLGPNDAGRPGTAVLSRVAGAGPVLLNLDDNNALQSGAHAFETLHDVTLFAAHNEIAFYTWGEGACYLPQGATMATLNSRGDALANLRVGDLLVFEEVRGARSGLPDDANPAHRHVVRLTSIKGQADPLVLESGNGGQPLRLVDITWAQEDALPFSLCLCEAPQDASLDPERRRLASVARGNVVLADHGLTVAPEDLEPIPAVGPYRPLLQQRPLTQQGQVRTARGDLRPLDPSASASAALQVTPTQTRPAITLHEGSAGGLWVPQRDLLESDRFAQDFVPETDEDQQTRLRFGDDLLGAAPSAALSAVYRVGNGADGNVGAEALVHLVLPSSPSSDAVSGADILAVRNPLAASGGVDSEAMEQVRLYAPQAFRRQERAVSDDDYAAMAQTHPEVNQARASRRWTGSWCTVFLTVSRKRGKAVDEAFKAALGAYLAPLRMAGDDLRIEGPRLVPLDVALKVRVKPAYYGLSVREALRRALRNTVQPDGSRGFFFPDNFAFGQPVYLSQLLTAVMQVPGVASAEATRFCRYAPGDPSDRVEGAITMQRLELPRLDNAVNQPALGRLVLNLEGGQ